jgi:hypothetical protein
MLTLAGSAFGLCLKSFQITEPMAATPPAASAAMPYSATLSVPPLKSA